MAARSGFTAGWRLPPRIPPDTPPGGRPGAADRRKRGRELVWAHATSSARLAVLHELGQRLQAQRGDVDLLITVEQGRIPGLSTLPDSDVARLLILDGDRLAPLERAAGRWPPDLCLWLGGQLMPNVIAAVAATRAPLVLLDVGEADLPERRRRWFIDHTRRKLATFDRVLTTSAGAAAAMRRLGVTEERITIMSRLRPSVLPPPCPEADLTAFSQALSSRPVWLAAHVTAEEFPAVIEAHQIALRLVHRLLLVILPEREADIEALRPMLAGANLRFATWSDGPAIEDHKQVLIADGGAGTGLWYRAAPVAFLAGSLAPGMRGISPLEAAALGTAILHGPNVRDHQESYARFAAAGAARIVNDGISLGSAIIQLTPPDQASELALAGWRVITESAEATDRLLDLVQETLDTGSVPHARA
ncbi:3-deoxy-D-manno-octulosonic acid transferase [Pontibaca methylaminivorans]|uniref:3-deoxy-D-manno-octulosonic acid transferase n=1 Tax=Pontibaca methylaminivorans TaxID=515897 RepID=UPI002FD96EB6